MPTKKRITPAERRHQDYLRRKTLQVASVYETRLEAARRKELRRVLAMAKDYSDPIALVPLIEGQIDETKYLGKWWNGLIIDAGLPIAKATARDLRAMKAADEEDDWLASLHNYATTRAGNEISIVTGTWKDTLVGLVRKILAEDAGRGIEKITKELYRLYTSTIEKWQCRRIAQTEAMIGMAEAANDAAQTLSIHFTKEWCISGLGNTRESHEIMDGMTVDEDEPFVLPGGMMMYPHDTSMNAAAGEIINCACCCIRRPKDSSSRGNPTSGTIPHVNKNRETRIIRMTTEMDSSIPFATRRAIAENILDFEKAFHTRKGKRMTIQKADIQSANRSYNTNDENTKINCVTCSSAFILRRRGFNLTAKKWAKDNLVSKVAKRHLEPGYGVWKNADGSAVKTSSIGGWMKSKKYKSMTADRYEEFFKEVCTEKGDYIVTLTWDGNYSRHATILTRDKHGNIYHVEPQVYNKKKGVKRTLRSLCERLTPDPYDADNIFRADDKIFDVGWVGLFDK